MIYCFHHKKLYLNDIDYNIWKSTEEKFEKVREDLYYIAESMIENRGNIRVKFDMKYDQEVITMYEENKAKEQLMAALKAKN